MKKQHTGCRSRADTVSKTASRHSEQGSERIADIGRDRSVNKRLVLPTLMASSATLAAIILRILHLGAFWHYFFLATCLVFTILAFVAVYLLNKEIDSQMSIDGNRVYPKRGDQCPIVAHRAAKSRESYSRGSHDVPDCQENNLIQRTKGESSRKKLHRLSTINDRAPANVVFARTALKGR
jgi:hypothetical protein